MVSDTAAYFFSSLFKVTTSAPTSSVATTDSVRNTSASPSSQPSTTPGTVSPSDIKSINISWDQVIGQQIQKPGLTVTVQTKPKITADSTTGKSVLELDGQGQEVSMTASKNVCVADPVICQQGFTLSLDVQLLTLREKTVVFSSGAERESQTGVSALYEMGLMRWMVRSEVGVWYASSRRLEINEWYTVDLSWQHSQGLSVYVNERLVTRKSEPIKTKIFESKPKPLIFGNSPITPGITETAKMKLGPVQVWDKPRIVLENAGIVSTGKIVNDCQSYGYCLL